MEKKISISLSEKSIQNAIKELNQYKNDLKRKNDEFVKHLAELGLSLIHI